MDFENLSDAELAARLRVLDPADPNHAAICTTMANRFTAVVERVVLQDEVLSIYVAAEEKYDRGQAEPFAMATEAGFFARQARMRHRLREARSVLACNDPDNLDGMARAVDVNGRICNAYLTMQGIHDKPWPNLADVSLEEAIAARTLVERFNTSDFFGSKPSAIYCVLGEDKLAKTLATALVSYEAQQARAHEAAVREGIGDADAGRTVPYEDVRKEVLSWGTSQEEPAGDA